MGAILVINAGSSSVKFAIYLDTLTCRYRGALSEVTGADGRFRVSSGDGELIEERRFAGSPDQGHHRALAMLLEWIAHSDLPALSAVGHRVVHGGTRFAEPRWVDAELMTELKALVPLAPLHQPWNLAGIDAVSAFDASLPQVACFDTAFHRSQPEVAQAFALPPEVTAYGIRRYGFHGLSYEYIAGRLQSELADGGGRTVAAHLGNGASLCAMREGRSVATTMGFTALDGLPMGTRCGDLDPGVVLYLIQQRGWSVDAVAELLYTRSGLKGVSGLSHDMRVLLHSDAPAAKAAVDLFVYRIGRELGSLAAALGGLDTLVFTAGIGEHAAPVRQAVCEGAAWLGVSIDMAANRAHATRIDRTGSRVRVLVLPTDEELVVARHVTTMPACT